MDNSFSTLVLWSLSTVLYVLLEYDYHFTPPSPSQSSFRPMSLNVAWGTDSSLEARAGFQPQIFQAPAVCLCTCHQVKLLSFSLLLRPFLPSVLPARCSAVCEREQPNARAQCPRSVPARQPFRENHSHSVLWTQHPPWMPSLSELVRKPILF